MVAAAFDRAPGHAAARAGVASRLGRARRLRAGSAGATGAAGLLSGCLCLADHVRPNGAGPTGLPGGEPEDALPVGLGLLALPGPSAADHRGPVRRAGLADPGRREV